MIGVSFDPAQQQNGNGASGPNAGSAPRGVQEAIKILSLRLPRVVGANAIAPQALLSSPGGSGGHVDSVVNRIMQRYFPQASPQAQQQMFAPMASPPMMASASPSEPQKRNPFQSNAAPAPFSPFGMPKITTDLPTAPFTGGPPKRPGQPTIDGGGEMWPFPAGTIAPPPPAFDVSPPPYEEPYPRI